MHNNIEKFYTDIKKCKKAVELYMVMTNVLFQYGSIRSPSKGEIRLPLVIFNIGQYTVMHNVMGSYKIYKKFIPQLDYYDFYRFTHI